jgi:hypothetical protein
VLGICLPNDKQISGCLWGFQCPLSEFHLSEEAEFVNPLRSYGLYITTRHPTRGSACLDAIATNFDSWDIESKVVKSLVADHDGTVVLNIKTNKVRTPALPSWQDNYSCVKRTVKSDDLPLFLHELSQTD